MQVISIVMPCYNRGHDLVRVLQAYDRQDVGAMFEVIAVDDASIDATYETLTSYHPVRFVLRAERQQKNQGPAAARNRGIALASAPLVLFVGDDILPKPDFVRRHLEAHHQRPEQVVAILGRLTWAHDIPQNTLMTHIDGVGAQQFSYYYLQDGREYDYRHLYTSNISLKRDFLWSLTHWFDTDFAYAALEDAELAFRLAKRGLRIIYSAAPLAEHYHYHTIWSFSARQYYAGLMSWVLIRKHPGVMRQLRLQYRRILRFLWKPRGLIHPEIGEWLEAQMLHLTSFYEWTPHLLLDAWYRHVLDYFYYKGVIEGMLGKTQWSTCAHRVHVGSSLLPLLGWFLEKAADNKIPLPAGLDASLPGRLARWSQLMKSGKVA